MKSSVSTSYVVKYMLYLSLDLKNQKEYIISYCSIHQTAFGKLHFSIRTVRPNDSRYVYNITINVLIKIKINWGNTLFGRVYFHEASMVFFSDFRLEHTLCKSHTVVLLSFMSYSRKHLILCSVFFKEFLKQGHV